VGPQSKKQILDNVISKARKRILMSGICYYFIQTGIFVLPLSAVLIAINNRMNGSWGGWIALLSLLIILGVSWLKSYSKLGGNVSSALAIDENAHLKDRITSAYEFMAHGELDEPQSIQVNDAIHYADSIDPKRVIEMRYPRWWSAFPLVVLLFCLSFFIPPALMPLQADAESDQVKQLQLDELAELEAILKEDEPTGEIEEVLRKLKEIKKQFEKGELTDRDVMIQLARVNQDLRQKIKEMGVDNLEGELNEIIPRLISASAAVEAANAIKENKLDKAADELEKLGDKVKKNKLTDKEKRELSMTMGIAASKLGGKQDGSFGGDFTEATKALENSNSNKFCNACKSMGDKLKMLKKARKCKGACKKIGSCKSCLGQCKGNTGGFKIGPKTFGKKKGGLMAGTAASGNPFGDSNRLKDSYRKMLRVTGDAGNGPVETEVEITEGQMSQSQVDLKEIYQNFNAVAEETMENELIPLSRRYHVKRYFQSIRPQE